ncbi:hypothetical protein ACFYUJ_39060 [Streptomyces sp. NPDC004520]|uniref:hypothetical protein n=1 Tax=Streptomyces sp. NPDC004520 TaxID=3364702 RepID=UPI0036B0F661
MNHQTTQPPATASVALAYRLGTFDAEGRHPVLVGEDVTIGLVFRWHREWITVSSNGETRVGRPAKGQRGAHMAAAILAVEYAAGAITALPKTATDEEKPPFIGPVPLLHPRMPDTPTNRTKAREAFAIYAAYHWTARSGYPGRDNHTSMICDLCGWTGPKYLSHLVGRNGEPPSINRHPGKCIGEDKIRALIPAYQK